MGCSIQNNKDAALDKAIINRYLRRSFARRRVALYLYDISPDSSYVADISRQTHLAPISVTGSLHGDSQYRKQASLITLNLVEQFNSNDMRLYRITDFGKEIVKEMEKKERM